MATKKELDEFSDGHGYRDWIEFKTYADSGKDKLESATRFDTKEEAESWTNAHQEVIEVDE